MTSAQTLSSIINEFVANPPSSNEQALATLMAKGWLPKKLIPSEKPVKKVSIFASQAAEDLADKEGLSDSLIDKKIVGTGQRAKITVKDIHGFMRADKVKANASPAALTYARDNNLDLSTTEGTGPDGKILLKDIKEAKPLDLKPAKPKLSPDAQKAVKKWQLDDADIEEVKGTGKSGNIKLSDLKDLIAATKKAWEAESDSDESEDSVESDQE